MRRADFLLKNNFMTGVNYWASHAGTEMWTNWDEVVIEKDMSLMAENGIQVLRVFPLWSDFQPIKRIYNAGGAPVEFRMGEEEFPNTEAGRAGVSELMMERFGRLSELAEKYGFTLIVALLTGHMTSRLFIPEGLAGLNPITNADTQVWQVRYVKYFIKYMKESKAIIAWEFGNECNCFGQAENSAQAIAWMTLISDAIRLSDPDRPLISGMDGQAIGDSEKMDTSWNVQNQSEFCDVVTTHHYTMWRSSFTDPFDSIKATMFPVAQNRMYSDIGNRPAFMEETGSWRPMLGNFDTHVSHLRNICWNLWANKGYGILWWCAFDQTNLNMAPYDWDFAGLEHGLFDLDHNIQPTGEEFFKFRKFVDSLPFDKLPDVKADALCIVGDKRQRHLDVGVASYILAKQAGFEVEFQYSRQPLRDAQLYLLPSACGKAGLGSKNWEKLRKNVKDGATVYMSMDDIYIDYFAEVFGAEVTGRSEYGNDFEYKFELTDGKVNLKLPNNIKYFMKECGANSLGSSEEGRPVFFEYKYGKGKVFLLSLPLEKIIMKEADAFLSPESKDAWKIYKHIASSQISGKAVMKDNPMLAVTEHYFDEKKMAVVAFNYDRVKTFSKLTVKSGWELFSLFSDSGDASNGGEQIKLSLEANSGIVLILEKK